MGTARGLRHRASGKTGGNQERSGPGEAGRRPGAVRGDERLRRDAVGWRGAGDGAASSYAKAMEDREGGRPGKAKGVFTTDFAVWNGWETITWVDWKIYL